MKFRGHNVLDIYLEWGKQGWNKLTDSTSYKNAKAAIGYSLLPSNKFYFLLQS